MLALALVVILIGLYLIISGLRERYQFEEDYERYFNKEYYKKYKDYYKEYEEERIDEDKKLEKKVKGGGVVIVGPIPIVFGDTRLAVVALILAIVLMILSITFMLLQHI